jgi:tripartite-type tricarboxylate transporter receptor subunit TctC
MKPARRKFLHLAAGTVALPAVSRVAIAQTYPTRPITVIVPTPPGGPTDAVGRVLFERMRTSLRQPIIIENVGGADGSIGVGRAARARPDGYTINLGLLPTNVLNGAFYSLPYDLLNDFAPISALVSSPLFLLVRKSIPAKDLKELIAWLKDNPDKASAAIATVSQHLLTALFQKQTSTRFAIVPYRGNAAAAQDLAGGHIDLAFGAGEALSLVRAGDIKAYAVTSDTRMSIAPEVPTFAELGLAALSYSAWIALFAPKATPPEIIGKLNAASAEALLDPTIRSRLIDFGFDIFPRERQTPEALGAIVKADAAKWWPIIEESGIKAE